MCEVAVHMQSVAASVWAFTVTMDKFAGAVWDLVVYVQDYQVLRGLSQPLCGLF